MSEQFHLYVVRPQDISQTERYFLITPDYSLLYTQNAPPEKSEEVTNLSILPPTAMEWLKERVTAIQAEYMKAHEKETLERAGDFVALFQAELERENERLKAGGDIAEGTQ